MRLDGENRPRGGGVDARAQTFPGEREGFARHDPIPRLDARMGG